MSGFLTRTIIVFLQIMRVERPLGQRCLRGLRHPSLGTPQTSSELSTWALSRAKQQTLPSLRGVVKRSAGSDRVPTGFLLDVSDRIW